MLASAAAKKQKQKQNPTQPAAAAGAVPGTDPAPKHAFSIHTDVAAQVPTSPRSPRGQPGGTTFDPAD